MSQLQQALNEQIAGLPKLALRQLLEHKLREQKIDLPSAAFEALLDHLLHRKGEEFSWNDGETGTDRQFQRLGLIFDENDAAKAQEICERLATAIPEIVENLLEKSGADLLKSFKEKWNIEGAVQRCEVDGFRDRLEERWGEGLHLLRMLLTTVGELGHEAAKRSRRSKSKKHACRRFVLMHLHVRACQVAEEIITLMENGFADGAMARWRTLHELDVVTTVIEDGVEELANRYIHHNVVETKKQADNYDKTLVSLGYPPVRPHERKRIEKNYADAIQRYGKPFGTDYGWAADHLNNTRPTFKTLQTAADQSGMNSYYKIANWNVHASARAMFFRLTDMGANIPIAGRSNAGLVEPGQNTAFTLVRITSALLGRAKDLDRLLEMKAIIALRDAIPEALHRADKKLRRDEGRVQRDNKRNAAGRR
jgi:hypothetical protein